MPGAEDGKSTTVKSTTDEQAALIEDDPDTFSKAPYVGQHGWLKVELKADLSRLASGALVALSAPINCSNSPRSRNSPRHLVH